MRRTDKRRTREKDRIPPSAKHPWASSFPILAQLGYALATDQKELIYPHNLTHPEIAHELFHQGENFKERREPTAPHP